MTTRRRPIRPRIETRPFGEDFKAGEIGGGKRLEQELDIAGIQPLMPDNHRERCDRKTIAKGEQIVERYAATADLPLTEVTFRLRNTLLREAGKNYSERVRQVFTYISDQADILQREFAKTLEEALNFSETQSKLIMEILSSFQIPDRDAPKRDKKNKLLVEHQASPAVWVGLAHALKKRLQGTTWSDKQKPFINRLSALLDQAIAADPKIEALHQYHYPEKKYKDKAERAKKSIKMLFLLGATGMAIFSAVASRRLNWMTAAYLGLAYWLAGGFKGKKERVAAETAFLRRGDKKTKTPSPDETAAEMSFFIETPWEELARKYEIRGEEWAQIIEELQSSYGRSLVRKLAKKEGDKNKISKDYFVAEIAPDTIKDSKAFKSFESMSQEELVKLGNLIGEARSTEAKEIVLEFVRSGVGPHSIKKL